MRNQSGGKRKFDDFKRSDRPAKFDRNNKGGNQDRGNTPNKKHPSQQREGGYTNPNKPVTKSPYTNNAPAKSPYTKPSKRVTNGDESSDDEASKPKKARGPNLGPGQTVADPNVNLPVIAKRTAVELTQESIKNARVVGGNAEVLAKTGFAALNLNPKLVEHLEAQEYTKPTHVQEIAIPVLLQRQDTLVKSETGSGKTLAFLLPVIHNLIDSGYDRITREKGTHVLIIAPTRELALQIESVYKIVSKPFHWLIATTIMGGENKKAEKQRLRKGVQIVIGTPGRIKDHMESTQSWNLCNLRWFILDEADRLMDLGFEQTMTTIYDHIKFAMSKTKNRCANVLVSATLTKGDSVDRLAGALLKDPLFVGFEKEKDEEYSDSESDGEDDADDTKKTVKSTADDDDDDGDNSDEEIKRAMMGNLAPVKAKKEVNESVKQHKTPTTLQQLYIRMSSRHRLVALASFLRLRIVTSQRNASKCKMIVFVSTCAAVEFLHKIFSHTFWPDHITGVKAIDEDAPQDNVKQPLLDTQLWKLHGNMPQKLRTATYFEFFKASEGIMFCTDVAARGLDLPAVDWIVQYDAPEDTEDYIHRVGRTARIGHSGQAVIFLVESELGYLDHLKDHGISLEHMPLERVLGGLHVGVDKSIATPKALDAFGRPMPAGAVLQKQLETMCTINPDLGNLSKEAYISFFRAYAAYPKHMKTYFHHKKLHFGEVAHSFGLTERPSDIGKKATNVHEQTKATINPRQARADAEAALKNRPKSLHQLARSSAKKGDVAEFI